MSQARYALNKNKYLLPPEVDRLRTLIRDHQVRDPRNCFMISVALRTGARAQEVLNIRKDDLNPYDRSVLIRGIKGSNDREIPIEEKFFNAFMAYVDPLPNQGSIFDISYVRLVQVWEFYRPVRKKFHSLRHTFAIELYQKTKDLRLVQVALGHRNITNTMIYADYVYSQQELRRLIL